MSISSQASVVRPLVRGGSFSGVGAGSSRRAVYYWKCDRPAAFHGVLRAPDPGDDARILEELRRLLAEVFSDSIQLSAGAGEGTHRTFCLRHVGQTYFVRVEDGPEGDTHLAMESEVMAAVAEAGVPVPRVFFCDVSRGKVPFSVQVIEYFEQPDLNRLHRDGCLALAAMAPEIGRMIGLWQGVPVAGFGPFERVGPGGELVGFHAAYADYFQLHLDRHLRVLLEDQFLTASEADAVRRSISDHAALLNLRAGTLVHKDLALWNILGDAAGVAAFIDWDDAIGGDPTDDLSLLACFHSADVLLPAVAGYESVRALPAEFPARFWLHLLRNMLVKAVIRVGAGYFRSNRRNFLVGSHSDGAAFREFTRKKLLTALRGLREDRPLSDL